MGSEADSDGESPWPAECRCGFVADNREDAEAHAILEHPEALTETGRKVHGVLSDE